MRINDAIGLMLNDETRILMMICIERVRDHSTSEYSVENHVNFKYTMNIYLYMRINKYMEELIHK